jgi:hypothetical protein
LGEVSCLWAQRTGCVMAGVLTVCNRCLKAGKDVHLRISALWTAAAEQQNRSSSSSR